MKIKKISCDQFAGLRGAELSFSDGVNILYGKNESGKSTVVSLISGTLFQDAKLGKQVNKGGAFAEKFFSIKKDGTKNSSIDGKIVFTTESGDFTLSKNWGNSTVKLITPDDLSTNQEEVNAVLEKELGYGKGVYSELLFSPQRGADEALEKVLSGGADSSKELTAILTAAFGESGGASVDVIEKALDEKISDIIKTTWDLGTNAPVRKKDGGRHQQKVGSILKAYYDLEDAKSALDEQTKCEQAAEEAKQAFEDAAAKLLEKKKERKEFERIAELLKNRKIAEKLLAESESKLRDQKDALQLWPTVEADEKAASALAEEKKNRSLLDQYEKADAARKECAVLREELQKMPCPSQEEISSAVRTQKEIERLKNSLCGMNLNSIIRMLDGHTVRITSLRTGEEIPLLGDTVTLSEAVQISVPGVMEMQLSPADVDVSAVTAEIKDKENVLLAIFEKYTCDCVEALQKLSEAYKEKQGEIKTSETKLNLVLNGNCFEEMEEVIGRIVATPRSMGEIENEILALCKGEELTAFVARKKQTVEDYQKRYDNLENLKKLFSEQEDEVRKAKESCGSEVEIPEKYRNISDPEGTLRTLNQLVKLYEDKEKELISAKSGADTLLTNFLNVYGDLDLAAEAEEKERVFLAEQEALFHWLHIKEVFLQEKEKLQGNPMQTLADSFTRYLAMITGGTAKSELPSRERLDIVLYSKDRPMEFAKLSEGTKETVSLAYRFAVLDELFPEGGGVIVLDDPFTDMDDERTARSCELVKECAKRHQVIFLTCKEEYLDMLGGKRIDL